MFLLQHFGANCMATRWWQCLASSHLNRWFECWKIYTKKNVTFFSIFAVEQDVAIKLIKSNCFVVLLLKIKTKTMKSKHLDNWVHTKRNNTLTYEILIQIVTKFWDSQSSNEHNTLNLNTYKCESPSATSLATRTSTKPLTRSSVTYFLSDSLAAWTSLYRLLNSPGITVAVTVKPLPAFSCEANEMSFLYFGRKSSFNLHNTRICGRQFLVWGCPSSSRNNEKRAADRAKPRIPSPHSFSALQ